METNLGIEEAVDFWLSKFEGDTAKSTAVAHFVCSLLARERPENSVVKTTALELDVEEEKLRLLVTLLFGEENPDIIE